jgi:hypothetical protein
MNQDQNNFTEVENNLNTEPPLEEVVETGVQESHKTTYLIAGSVVLGCLILAAAYIYVQTATVEKEINIQIPVGIEENESDQVLNFDTESDEEELKPASGEKVFVHTLSNDPAKYDNYYKKLVSQDGVVWQEHPTSVGDLQLFSVAEEYQLKDKKFQYYQVGTVNDKPLYVTFVPYCEMGCTNSMLYFIGSDTDSYTFLRAQSTNKLTGDYFGFALSNKVRIDEDFTLDAHQIPEKIVISDVDFSARLGSGRMLQSGPSFFADTYYNLTEQENGQVTEFFAETEYGPAFRGLRNIGEGNTKDLDYAVRLAGGLMLSLHYKPDFIWDDRVPKIGWLDGTNNESPYRTDGLSSCGGGGPETMSTKIPEEGLLLAGYTINQEPVYKVTDPNQYVITRLFTEGDTRNYYEYNTATKKTETGQITKSDFIDEGGVIIYVDEFGFQHVLTHTKYGPQAECAKPVVYLYPEETTDVRVELDALVTVSEPEYGSGWDVTANPDGVLSMNGAEFESLFWDGYGNGEYPEITQGFVVPTEDATSLMEEHLQTMGFNKKEISDFVEFWEPYMPNEPYTRFSWIGTIGMENLAKLTISPEPDTLIRAFVDFEGIDEEIEIEPQTIPSYERIGFVATEWGGLLKR